MKRSLTTSLIILITIIIIIIIIITIKIIIKIITPTNTGSYSILCISTFVVQLMIITNIY